jgi:hypothetical protein
VYYGTKGATFPVRRLAAIFAHPRGELPSFFRAFPSGSSASLGKRWEMVMKKCNLVSSNVLRLLDPQFRPPRFLKREAPPIRHPTATMHGGA